MNTIKRIVDPYSDYCGTTHTVVAISALGVRFKINNQFIDIDPKFVQEVDKMYDCEKKGRKKRKLSSPIDRSRTEQPPPLRPFIPLRESPVSKSIHYYDDYVKPPTKKVKKIKIENTRDFKLFLIDLDILINTSGKNNFGLKYYGAFEEDYGSMHYPYEFKEFFDLIHKNKMHLQKSGIVNKILASQNITKNNTEDVKLKLIMLVIGAGGFFSAGDKNLANSLKYYKIVVYLNGLN